MSVPEAMYNEDLEQRRRQRQQESHSKKAFALFQTLSFLFHVVQFVTKCLRIFPELSSKGLCLSLHEEKENRCPVFTFSMKREIRRN